jgi:hypothetical protein
MTEILGNHFSESRITNTNTNEKKRKLSINYNPKTGIDIKQSPQ